MAARISGDEKSEGQCRDRWVNHLEPKALGLKVGGWTLEEDELSQEEMEELGGRKNWKAITARFPDRAQSDVKSRYYNNVTVARNRAAAAKAAAAKAAARAKAAAARATAAAPEARSAM